LGQADLTHGVTAQNHRLKSQFDTIHLDETWFYLQCEDNYVILIDGVPEPDAPTTQHKSHIEKIMFLVP
jgi:hypothetical protein